MSESKLIFTGVPGAGKTIAIGAISDSPPIVTDASTVNNIAKAITTVSMDFGEITLDSDIKVHLYGMPGQERFKFIWEIIVKGGLGLIILIDHSRPNPIEDMDIYLDNFASFIEETGAVIGITKMDLSDEGAPELEQYYNHLEQRGISLPVLSTNVRDSNDVIMLLDYLVAILEYS
ncbi:MAG: ATP/GTP-binding protein [Gammaproteobacteria bacterium]|nr:ATP/GTP-binding protein [Gammaproteobacteria bacterium]